MQGELVHSSTSEIENQPLEMKGMRSINFEWEPTETCVVLQIIAWLAGANEGSHRVLTKAVGTGNTFAAFVDILTGLVVKREAFVTGACVGSHLVDAFSRSAGIH
jgi:hypothetical protein